ncbi:MAG: hypothetical protein ACR2G6_00985 [Gemmatimonadaceae bacterium]
MRPRSVLVSAWSPNPVWLGAVEKFAGKLCRARLEALDELLRGTAPQRERSEGITTYKNAQGHLAAAQPPHISSRQGVGHFTYPYRSSVLSDVDARDDKSSGRVQLGGCAQSPAAAVILNRAT